MVTLAAIIIASLFADFETMLISSAYNTPNAALRNRANDSVINAATPGYSIGNLLHDELHTRFPVDMDMDLIIVDYGVNDAITEPFEFDLNNIKLAHETLVSHVRNDMIHMPALIYAETFIAPARARAFPLQGGNMADVHAAVTIKYGVPMVSFRDAVWPDLEDNALADLLWGPQMHPSWQAQQLLADVLVYFVQKSYARFLEEHGLLENPSPHEKALSLVGSKMGCMADERSFVLVTDDLVGLPPPEQLVESVEWSFRAGMPGRPGGLIAFGDSPQKAIVSFDLPCAGKRRVLDIGYLKSFSGMGAVKVVVRGSDTDPNYELADKGSNDDVVVVLDGQWQSRAALQVNEIIPIPNGFDIIRVTFELLSADTEASYAGFLSGLVGSASDSVRGKRKFKVTRMQCC